jgi:hypothetical protein
MNESLLLYSVASLLALVVIKWHMSLDSSVDLQYLLVDTETKKLSIFKAGQVLALIVSTWIVVRETNHDRLNEWLFGGYMFAWAGANLANRALTVKEKSNADVAIK